MAKLKPGPGKQARHKRYKDLGRKILNKEKKAKRHEKRMQRFADRKAAGKCYEYDKERTEQKRKWNEEHPDDRYEFGSNINSGQPRHTEFAQWDKLNTQFKKFDIENNKIIADRIAFMLAKNKKKDEE